MRIRACVQLIVFRRRSAPPIEDDQGSAEQADTWALNHALRTKQA